MDIIFYLWQKYYLSVKKTTLSDLWFEICKSSVIFVRYNEVSPGSGLISTFMRKVSIIILFLAFVISPKALAQEQSEKTAIDYAAEETETMIEMFKLDDYQAYQIDSMLQVNYGQMLDELDKLQKSGAQNRDMFINVQDKYLDIIDNAVEQILTESQWAKYMKSQYGREKKQRDSKKAKAEAKEQKSRK